MHIDYGGTLERKEMGFEKNDLKADRVQVFRVI